MLTWLNVFVNNLATPLFWFAITGALVSVTVIIFSYFERKRKLHGSIGYAAANRRIWHAVRWAIGLAVIYSFVAAVPKANYQVQIKEIPVDRVVPEIQYKTPTAQEVFKDLYQTCMGNWSIGTDDSAGSNESLRRRMETCTNMAVAGMHANDNTPPPQTQSKTITTDSGTVQVDVQSN